MQAPSTLSPEQKHALEATYVFFSAAIPLLQSIQGRLLPDERLQAGNLRDLADLCEHRLVESFPELHQWIEEWKRGGVA